MTRWTLCAAIAAALAAAPASAAVTLNPGGLGQGLLFPYFTTHNGQTTMLALQNTSDQGKALKVRVLESYAGKETLTFNLYLPPGGSWNAALTQRGQTAGAFASLVNSDTACTAPIRPDGNYDLLPYAFEGDNGPQTGERSREGLVEVVEMGALSAELSALVTPATSNCLALNIRHIAGGIWRTNPNADLSAPNGGLRGTALIIDTANGTAFNYAVLAFDGLAIAPRQFILGIEQESDTFSPRLTDIQVADGDDIEVNLLDATGAPVTLRYAADEGYNAISALLASHVAHSTFNVDAGLRARSEWIYSMPTRRAHAVATDLWLAAPQPPGSLASAPFAFNPDMCEVAPLQVMDRTGGSVDTADSVQLCGVAGVVRFAAEDDDTSAILALDGDATIESSVAAGTATFDFSQANGTARQGTADLDGLCYTGLPVWAMTVSAYDNDNAQAGRIATYPVEEVASRSTTIVDCSAD